MRQKSKTCNRRYPLPRAYCQASSYIDGDARAALRETQDLEGAEGHSNFGILSSFNPSPARTIRASVLIHERPIHLESRPARDHHWVDPVGADVASSRRAVSHSARRSLALRFLLAIFRRQVPPAEPSLLNQYHLPWYFEINRDHHLRSLAEGNRQ
jgi:hypothetical protein